MKQGNFKSNDNIQFKKRRSFANISMTKPKRSIKAKNSILIKKWVQFSNEKDLLTTFVNLKIKINFINWIYII